MIHHGDCIEVMATMPDALVDAVVTDPPYGLEFMGKEWDRLAAPTGGASFAAAKGKRDQRPENEGGTWFGSRDGSAPNYTGSPNPSCRNCKGSLRGNDRKGGFTRCRCENPDFPNHRLSQSKAMQAWHEAWAREAFRVLKPGGYLLAFGGTRTVHRLASAIEDAGFEIRDTLVWLHLQGFPKSLNIGDGRGTALKPAHEPIVMARKPLIGSVRANVERYGTGALNIDKSRIPAGLLSGTMYGEWNPSSSQDNGAIRESITAPNAGEKSTTTAPAALWESSATASAETPVADSDASTATSRPDIGCSNGTTVDGSATSGSTAESGKKPTGRSRRATSSTTSTRTDTTTASRTSPASPEPSMPPSTSPLELGPRSDPAIEPAPSVIVSDGFENSNDSSPTAPAGRWPSNVVMDEPVLGDDYSRFFLIPKADRADREPVLRGAVEAKKGGSMSGPEMRPGKPTNHPIRENSHPTVKPTELMRHLVRLVTPPGGTVLDCFAGSGTTAIAAELEGFQWIAIEREAEYVEIMRARLNGVQRGLGLDVAAPSRRPPRPAAKKRAPVVRVDLELFPGVAGPAERDEVA